VGKRTGLGGMFGARYGTIARKRYVTIVSGMRQRHECPRCRIKSVRRLSVGIWHCRKCGYKFAGGAYLPFTKLGETSRRVASSFKPAVTEVKPETLEEEKLVKKRKEKAKIARKPQEKRTRKPKAETGEKTEGKRTKKSGRTPSEKPT
jgi:large subunit ribosomal protein L37Ae